MAIDLQPPSCLLAGPAGSGKTFAIATMVKAGIETFVIVTEPDGAASLIDACERIDAPMDKLHWTRALPKSQGWAAFRDLVTKISTMDQKGLSEVRDLGKANARPAAMNLLDTLEHFKCDRTGEDYGDFTTWDDKRCLVIDSLTGFSTIAFALTVGYKPTPNQGEWGIAQNFVYNLLLKINSDRQCFFILTSHIEKENDDLTGVRKITVSTIGAKLAPKVPPFFSEVIRTRKNPDQTFNWATLDTEMDLKNRSLPNSNKLEPDFKPVVDAYHRRLKLAGGTATTSASPSTSVAS